jgi:hypothetical protein
MFEDYFQTFVTFCVTLLFLNIIYIVFSTLTLSNNLIACILFGVLLHYILLSSFMWMLSLGVLQYLLYNKVFVSINNFFKKSLFFAFGNYDSKL